MSRLVTLSRAARLVGTSRGELQKRIRNGQLTTFEGMIEVSELLRVYPQTKMEETAMLERAEQIMERAVNKVVTARTEIPDAEILAERVATLSNELAQVKAAMSRQMAFVDEIEERLADALQDAPDTPALTAFQAWFVGARREQVQPLHFPEHFAARDALLRIIAADVKVLPSGHEFLVEGRDTILEAALNSGCNLDYGCSDGSCGLCKARVISGRVKQTRGHGYSLTDDEKDNGVVLSCCTTAITDLVIEAAEAVSAGDIPAQHLPARIKALDNAGDRIRIVHLKTPASKRLRFLAGQYATLAFGSGQSFDIPIASCPCHETYLEFHVADDGHSEFAGLLADALKHGDPVAIDGPKGGFTLQEDSSRPIVCIAWELGFAPVKSLIEHAMALDITESIHLYWFAGKDGGHYMMNLCRAWNDALDDFKFTPVVTESSGAGEEPAAEAEFRRVVGDYPDLLDFNVYVAGPAPVIEAARKLFTAHGLQDSHLFTEVLPVTGG